MGLFDGGVKRFGIRDLQYGESFVVQDPVHFFHRGLVFGNMFEDMVGDEHVECAIGEGEVGGVGLPDVLVDVAVEAGDDVGRGDGGQSFYEIVEMFFG